jgi:hypothetical protein
VNLWQKRLKIQFPVCGKHYFWLKGMQITDFVLFMIWLSHSWGMPYDLFSPVLLWVIWILSIVFKPVRIRGREDSYTMIIRNEDYAREFSMLNSLNPI